MSNLEMLRSSQCCRALDIHFAQWLAQQKPDLNPKVELLAALVSQQLGEGHVCIHLQQIPMLTMHWPESLKLILTGLNEEEQQRQLLDQHILGDGSSLTPLVLDKQRVYLYRYWRYECDVASDLRQRARPTLLDWAGLKEQLDSLFMSAESPDWQRVAAATAVTQRLAIISGGPGTGKTTTITKMLAIYLQRQLMINPDYSPVIKLAAPTGKAAARLSESISAARDTLQLEPALKSKIPDQGTTLHRLLGARPHQGGFKYHQDNPLHLDLLVVDEASMIDLPMMAQLLSALPPTARLILIGDKEQLASVEAGSVLGDICTAPENVGLSEMMSQLLFDTCHVGQSQVALGHSFADSVALLKKSYRFTADSGIGALSRAVNSGDSELVKKTLNEGFSDITFITSALESNTALIAHMFEKYADYFQQVKSGASPEDVLSAFSRFQVLCGLRKGILGIETLNQVFEKEAEKNGYIQMVGRWYAGRPVMITRNDAALNLYNGDIGIALPDKETGLLKVWFSQAAELVSYSTSRLPQHETVFAMTVHKSQGSEFDDVTLVLVDDAKVMSRELVYTGITRAKKFCTLFGSNKAIFQSTKQPTIRMSGLSERLWGE